MCFINYSRKKQSKNQPIFLSFLHKKDSPFFICLSRLSILSFPDKKNFSSI